MKIYECFVSFQVYFFTSNDGLEKSAWGPKKAFLFHFKGSFRSWDSQILTFQVFKCHDVIKCLSMKHKTHETH